MPDSSKNNISRFNHCFGCGVCAVACPCKIISMHINADGFYSPNIDESKCIECGICLDVCSFNHSQVSQDKSFAIQPKAVWSNNEQVRHICSSGGAGFEIGRYLLQKGYKAIACRYNSITNRAEHYIAETEDELKASIGSKYIQSDSFKGFSQIEKGQKYFIVGTPCQIDSIRRWVCKLKMESDVILLDFFCHGVPSMLMWDKYINEVEQKVGKFDNIIWRDKETGWHDSWVMKVPERYSSWYTRGDLFYKMFLGNRCLGKQCYDDCKYKFDQSAADIRIGDLWGTRYENDEKGVSGVLCMTRKGFELIEEMKEFLHEEISTIDIVGECQMKKCAHKPISYNYVMKLLKKDLPLFKIHEIASRIDLMEKIPNSIKYYTHRLSSKIIEFVGLRTKLRT